MEVLELKPIKNKTICVYLIKNTDKTFEFLKNVPVSFSSVDLTGEDFKKFENSLLLKLLRKKPVYQVDMPQHARDHLYEEIVELDEEINELLGALQKVKDKESHKAESIKCWIDTLTEELKEKKRNLELKIRPQWIVKKVLDLIQKCKDEKVSLVHVAKDETFSEIFELLKKLRVEVIIFKKNIVHVIPNKTVAEEEINQWKY